MQVDGQIILQTNQSVWKTTLECTVIILVLYVYVLMLYYKYVVEMSGVSLVFSPLVLCSACEL